MPGGFAEVLLEHGCLPRILQLVELQLVRQAYQEGYVRVYVDHHTFRRAEVMRPGVCRPLRETKYHSVPHSFVPHRL